MKYEGVKALTFDVGGTVFDWRGTIEAEVISLAEQKGITLDAPLHLSWSCYQNEDVPCGECDSCALRARGFELAGITDPILL